MAVAVIPDAVTQQRFEALEKANEIRLWRAERKAAMTVDLAVRIILGSDPEAVGWRLSDLLMSVPQFGVVKVEELMMEAGIRRQARLGRLTDRKRMLLARGLREREDARLAYRARRGRA
jgi:hypothetical protein